MNALMFFVFEDMQGYAIVDTGATKSMTGLDLMCFVQEAAYSALGEDLLLVDLDQKTRFTFANNSQGLSSGRVGVPHPIGLDEEGGAIWFALVTQGPTLLGMDYILAAGADVRNRAACLEFPDGHCEPLTRLRSGHLGLPLL